MKFLIIMGKSYMLECAKCEKQILNKNKNMKLGQHLRCKCANILRRICSLLNNFNFLQSTRYINNL